MKVLLFFSGTDSLSHIFHEGFTSNGYEVKYVNYLEFLPNKVHLIDEKYANFMPYKYRTWIRNNYLALIQKKYLNIVKSERPELVFIYNDQMVEGETVREIKKLGVKVGVYLADSAFFLTRRFHIMQSLWESDHIFAPDSFWLHQLNLIGMNHTQFIMPGYSSKTVSLVSPTSEEKEKYSSDLVYIGSPYKDVWGYKRALFLNNFSEFNIKIYGPQKWERWFTEFPALQEKFVLLKERLTNETVNTIMNCCQIYPIDANPGSLNGIHIRVFDAIGAGILPITEYKADIHCIFKDVSLPFYKTYNSIPEITSHYLTNQSERIDLIKKLRVFINNNYTPTDAASIILKNIFGQK